MRLLSLHYAFPQIFSDHMRPDHSGYKSVTEEKIATALAAPLKGF